MIREVEIKIWDMVVGYAAYGDSTLVSFEYDKKFPPIYDLAPVMMPRSREQVWSFDLNKSAFHGLPGLLADSLPDRYGNQMIDAWFLEHGQVLGEISALDRLCYLGTRAMGALEYFPSHNLDIKDDAIDIASLVALSREILQQRKKFKTSIKNLDTLIQIGSSAGGARAKAVIAFNPNTLEIKSGQIMHEGFEPWIIKLDGVTNQSLGDPEFYTNIEYAYYLMARDCEIEMTDSRLLEDTNRYHFMTKRFDRTVGGSKLHMQTLAALVHLDYNQARVHSYDILFKLSNVLKLSMSDKEQIFKRMVFNVLARNHDDHVKNFSFLMDKEAKWTLAPAYDMTFAYDPNNHWLNEHNLLINAKSADITGEDLLSYARTYHIKNANDLIDQIQDRISDFAKYAKKAKLSKDKTKYISNSLLRI